MIAGGICSPTSYARNSWSIMRETTVRFTLTPGSSVEPALKLRLPVKITESGTVGCLGLEFSRNLSTDCVKDFHGDQLLGRCQLLDQVWGTHPTDCPSTRMWTDLLER